jgi:ribosome biogenesis protein SSF1/2
MPDLSKLTDVSDIMGDGMVSESEGEDDATVDMERERTRKRRRDNPRDEAQGGAEQRALRLREIGPRLTLQLLKVEKEFLSGDVLYHRLVKRTPEELSALKLMKAEKAALKAQRKLQQEINVARKSEASEAKKARRKARKANGLESDSDDGDDEGGSDSEGTDTEAMSDMSEDDDVKEYIKEVGRGLPAL